MLIGTVHFTGIGGATSDFPPGAIQVFLGSDREGLFGYQCPRCEGYWRSRGGGPIPGLGCPYCGARGPMHGFITEGQQAFIERFCELYAEAMNAETSGRHVIDLDAIADATPDGSSRPAFLHSERRQQTLHVCRACKHADDVLGRYVYCSGCGTFNVASALDRKLADIRTRIKAGDPYADCLRDAVSAFDGAARATARQLANRIPMTDARRKHWSSATFFEIADRARELQDHFDIQLSPEAVTGAAAIFLRRHVHEHLGGEADEAYIRKSGVDNVRVRQLLRETDKSAYAAVAAVARLADDLSAGFHSIFPAASAKRPKPSEAQALDGGAG